MLLYIHNLPQNIQISDIKRLIVEKCGIQDIILDNLINDGGYNKRVTVGLADEEDAALLKRNINGVHLHGLELFVRDIRKTLYSNYENKMLVGINPLPQNSYYAQHDRHEYDLQNRYNRTPFASYTEKAVHHSVNDRQISKHQNLHRLEIQSSRYSSTQNDEFQWRENRNETETSRHYRGYSRSPDRIRQRFNSRDSESITYHKSKWNETDKRNGRDRSPPRYNDYMNPKWPLRHDRLPSGDRFNERNNRHDCTFDKREENHQFKDHQRDYARDQKRHIIDHHDQEREQRHGHNRFEKPRNYDQHRGYNQREFEKKRSYSEVSQTSTRTYKTNPNKSSFSTSNVNIFDKQSRNDHDGNYAPKRARLNQEKPMLSSVDLKSKSGSTSDGPANKPTDLKKLMIKHTNWRYQIAASLAKQIISEAHPAPLPIYTDVYKKMKESIVARIDVILGASLVASLPDMQACYRAKFGTDDDKNFFNEIMDKTKRGRKDAAVTMAEHQNNKFNATVNKNVPGKPNDAATNVVKPGLLTLPGANSNARLAAPQFHNRALMSSPQFPNRAQTPTSQCKSPTSIPQLQSGVSITAPILKNRAVTPSPQFQAKASTSTPQLQSGVRFTAPRIQDRAPISSPEFQNRAPTSIPQIQGEVPITAPQLQNSAPTAHPTPIPQLQSQPSTSSAPTGTKLPKVVTESATKKLLQYPLSKKAVSQQKQIHQLEYEDEDLYVVDPTLKDAIAAEVDDLVGVYTTSPNKHMDPLEQKIYHRIMSETVPIFKKVVKLHLTKRTMDITTGLVLRVFPSPKWPNHAALGTFLKEHGVVSTKKCPKMYVAVCASYQSYDNLLAMDTVPIGDTSVTFKPMHVAGPRKSIRQKLRKPIMQVAGLEGLMFDDETDPGVLDLEDDDFCATDFGAHDKVDADKVRTDETEDVILIETAPENIVVIPDDTEQAAPTNNVTAENVDNNFGTNGGTKENVNEKSQSINVDDLEDF